MSGHAPIAPSALFRTVQCSGWLRLAQSVPPEALAPEDQGEASAEGVAAHWALAEILQGRTVQAGCRAPNGVLVDDEMLEAVDVAVDAVESLVQEFGGTGLVVEQPVAIKPIHPQCWGTPDLRFWGAARGQRFLLVVLDYKHGHEFVEVFENWQLLAYSIGEIASHNLTDMQVEVVNVIVQPRSFHRDGPVRRWRYKGEDIRALVNIASNMAHEAMTGTPRLIVGPACKYCPARLACSALTKASGGAMDLAQSAIPSIMSPSAVGVELHFAERAMLLLKARVDALQQQGLAMARAGKNVPGYRIEHSEGREVWTKPDEEVIALGKMLQLDFAKPPAPITPKQAADKGLPEPLRKSFAKRSPGAAALVADDGSRARRIFGGGLA